MNIQFLDSNFLTYLFIAVSFSISAFFYIRLLLKSKFSIKFLIFLTIFAALALQTLMIWANILDLYLERTVSESILSSGRETTALARVEDLRNKKAKANSEEAHQVKMIDTAKQASLLFNQQYDKLIAELTGRPATDSIRVTKLPFRNESSLRNYKAHQFKVSVPDSQKAHLVSFFFDRLNDEKTTPGVALTRLVLEELKDGGQKQSYEKDTECKIELAPGDSVISVRANEEEPDDETLDDPDEIPRSVILSINSKGEERMFKLALPPTPLRLGVSSDISFDPVEDESPSSFTEAELFLVNIYFEGRNIPSRHLKFELRKVKNE